MAAPEKLAIQNFGHGWSLVEDWEEGCPEGLPYVRLDLHYAEVLALREALSVIFDMTRVQSSTLARDIGHLACKALQEIPRGGTQ